MADWISTVLKTAPLVSAAAWLLLAALQVYRDRWHTWTERFFLLSCFFPGFYAIGDWLFFNADPNNLQAQKTAALISLTGLVLAINFFLLFTLTFVMLIVVLPTSIESVVPPSAGGVPIAIFAPIPFALFLVYAVVYTVLGIWNLYRLYRIVRVSSKTLARRAAGLMVTFTLVLVLGLGTNGLLGVIQSQDIPPPLSTLLIFVAASAYYTLYPVGRQRISEAIRLFQARRYSIKAVFLTYGDGTLIGSKVRPGEKVVDEDLFGATLDVIQNFMRTSFPILRGKSLSAITHGSYTLIMERGRYAYITVVLEGEESDQLRRQMRDLLLDFEAENRQVLVKWQGVPSDAKGTEEMLTAFFIESPLV